MGRPALSGAQGLAGAKSTGCAGSSIIRRTPYTCWRPHYVTTLHCKTPQASVFSSEEWVTPCSLQGHWEDDKPCLLFLLLGSLRNCKGLPECLLHQARLKAIWFPDPPKESRGSTNTAGINAALGPTRGRSSKVAATSVVPLPARLPPQATSEAVRLSPGQRATRPQDHMPTGLAGCLESAQALAPLSAGPSIRLNVT